MITILSSLSCCGFVYVGICDNTLHTCMCVYLFMFACILKSPFLSFSTFLNREFSVGIMYLFCNFVKYGKFNVLIFVKL